MRYSTPLFGLIGAAAGLAVATTGYQLATAPLAPVADPAEPVAAVGKPLPAAPAEVRSRFAPCTRPAHLEHGVCVTEEWHTTVVYDAPAPPAQPPTAPQVGAGPTAPVRTAPAEEAEDDHEEADDQAEHEVEAHADDGGEHEVDD